MYTFMTHYNQLDSNFFEKVKGKRNVNRLRLLLFASTSCNQNLLVYVCTHKDYNTHHSRYFIRSLSLFLFNFISKLTTSFSDINLHSISIFMRVHARAYILCLNAFSLFCNCSSQHLRKK